ncbi:MAG: hypothetical protein A2901_04035 [Elusimicrobia bacterium RIFCSPLOWO2_01_FULL_54_10]|nr:MAG: hypothetical protein A2901_04035 [Elusimicrobia bacterium RIFCSPLOWO2_01_FULL_54_10]
MFSPGTNPIEKIKAEKDGLDILQEIETLAANGYANLSPQNAERLKWIGTFLRKKTPGFFMMRVRITGGRATAKQFHALAQISERLGNEVLDITTRQQIELRAIRIESVPQILKELEDVDLNSLQTGLDNIRGVNTCALAGLTPNESLDAYPLAVDFTNVFLNNKDYTNLPRKMNVTLTGCLENCTHPESQDIGLVPASKVINGSVINGFNVFVGGKMGSGGFYNATVLDVFVPPEDAVSLCSEIPLIFRDHGFRAERTKARLAFLLEAWGMEKFRAELEARWTRRFGGKLERAGTDLRKEVETDHLGVTAQKQPGLNAVGLSISVGRVSAKQLHEIARLSEVYGSSEIRITPQQNMILVNVPQKNLKPLLDEPLLTQLPPNPTPLFRGLVSCVGIDYCSLALIETKGIAVKVTENLEKRLGKEKTGNVRMRWSGCAAGCGNHHTADIGFQGIKANIDGKIVDAVHVFVGGKTGKDARPAEKIMELVPCDILPDVLEPILRNMTLLKKVRRDVEAEQRVVMIPAESCLD